MDTKRAKIVSEWLNGTTFRDEPIRRPGAENTHAKLPAPLKAARAMEATSSNWQSWKPVFLKQGRMLAGYEDDFEFPAAAKSYLPTYQTLSDEELRGYFTWRTRLRRGEYQKTSHTFMLLYLSELINQIGVPNPWEGYQKLLQLLKAYHYDEWITSRVRCWTADYIIYYGLDRSLFCNSGQIAEDHALNVMDEIASREDSEIIDAARLLAPRWLERSRFYAEYAEDMNTVIVRSLRRIAAHFDTHFKKTMAQYYFGSSHRSQIRLFENVLFCDPLKRKDVRYEVNEQRIYLCENGVWYLIERHANPRKDERLTELLKAVDAAMREASGFGNPIRTKLKSRWTLQIVSEEARRYYGEQQAAEAQKVSIDFTKLGRIREDAEITRDRLIVYEEAPEEARPAPSSPPGAPEQAVAPGAPSDAPEKPSAAAEGFALPGMPLPAQQGLPGAPEADAAAALLPAERRLLLCLLRGEETGWVQAEGRLLSVLADGINEKLYDTFQDTVLDTSREGGPQVLIDYIDELKEMIAL